ncbi:hypothetical protein IX39_16810 [Chryseobacterium formosense]|uniref:Protein NO VEIN C-terminal domain-containing protein n=1 Tax=Chryseobacterium formosense TaxID=236814 RepID=A0A085Z0U4_9FLAO|nr:DUF3883 domain-containing protein [Chryseobacterium formosense]KFE98057.1 hypothetical protein IX39_16810 [Chryseobacterium formosense]SFT72669.1 protein of unknown function [Chryseobacterium formosense]
METITLEDLKFINELSKRKYPGKKLTSNTNELERIKFNSIKVKLRNIALYFANKYESFYGPFSTNVSPEANPITLGETLHNVWSTLFKGSSNKQYAAQISFVIEKGSPYLNVGFYFGRSSTRSKKHNEKKVLENELKKLGLELSYTLQNNLEFRNQYNSLFEIGFNAYSNGEVLPDKWINSIKYNPDNSQITVKVFTNEFGVIENSILDFYVSQIIFLMNAITSTNSEKKIKPLTPEQSAKKAERNAQIGLKGELFILKYETERLNKLGLLKKGYPRHLALESAHYGFDILSLDDNGNDQFIEVKTTTRKKEDPLSKQFYITNNEYNVLSNNRDKYKIKRVYNIENIADVDDLNIDLMERIPNGYIVLYK